MNKSDRDKYVNYRLKKADETFEVAELLINNQKWNSAINRLYYSAYYAVSALLIKAEIHSKTHTGVKTLFFLNYIKTGIIPLEFGKVYSDLFDWRQKGDYGDFFDFMEADVNLVFSPTQKLIEKVKAEIEK